MLILRRKAGESIVIGSEIKVTVIDINEGSIRLAIDAPKRIPVLRSELLQAAAANRDAASQPDAAMPQSLLSLLPHGTGQPSVFGKERPAMPEPPADGADLAAGRPSAGAPATGTPAEETAGGMPPAGEAAVNEEGQVHS